MPYYDDEMTDRAARLYHSDADRRGLTVPQPSRSQSRREGDRIVLAAGGKTLAVYEVTARFGEDWLERV